MTNFEKIIELHKAFNAPKPEKLEDLLDFRHKLLTEEFKETEEAVENLKRNPENKELKAELLKELTDVLVIAYGSIEMLGWDADAAFKEVHESNMSKLGDDGKPIFREDGKYLKGPNYRKPDMTKLVE